MPRRIGALAAILAAACGDGASAPPAADAGPVPDAAPPVARLEPLFRSGDFAGCTFASPLAGRSQGAEVVLVATGGGVVAGLDPTTGDPVFQVPLPAPALQDAHVAATPALVDQSLVVAWQDRLSDGTRVSHHVGVVDLEARALDPAFADTTLTATKTDAAGVEIPFLPGHNYSRATIAVARPGDRALGLAYVGYGNIQDLQPWHGWVFELDLDAWRAGGPAVSGVLLTTAQADCGPEGGSGAREMLCGGGVWSPAGPKVFPTADGYDLIVPTGNGHLDPNAGAFANTMMRTGRGLAFDPGCDPLACKNWDEHAPSRACEDACANLFIPRLPGQTGFDTPACDELSFFECYAQFDWDLGANSPARLGVPGGPDVLVVPAKDGGVYLVDAEYMGTLYDRRQIAAVCGSEGSTCAHDWAGMMVTEPAVTRVGGEPVVLIPTFIYDPIHPAGLVALKIGMDAGGPRLEPFWQIPDPATPEAVDGFREHDGRVALATVEGEEYALVLDVDNRPGMTGTLYLVRIRDGAVVDRQPLAGPGQRYVEPLVTGGAVYLTSCNSDSGPSQVEAFRLEH